MRNKIYTKAFLYLTLLVFTPGANAQLNRSEAVGAYIYNFANLSSSPLQNQRKDYSIAIVTKKKELVVELNKLSSEPLDKNKKIQLIHAPDGIIDYNNICMVFIGDDKLDLYKQIFDKTKKSEILLVSENYPEKKDIVLNIFDTKDSKLHFEINKGNIYQRNIKIKDEILMMGGTEIDLVELYLKSQKKLNTSDSMLNISNKTLITLEKEMKSTEEEIEKLKSEVEKQRSERQKLIDDIKAYATQIEIQKQEYGNTLKRLGSYNDSLKNSRKKIHTSLVELNKYQEDITNNNNKLEQLNNAIDQKGKVLQEKNITIKRQQSIVAFFVAGIVFTIVLLILLFRSFKNIRKKNLLLIEQKEQITEKNNKLKYLNFEFEQQNEELKSTLDEIKRIQNQLVQSEKMASLGVLSAGIAHEINNPINFVYAGINSLLKDFEDIEPVIKAIHKINPETDNLKQILLEIKNLKEEYYFDDAFEAIPHIIKDIKLGADRTAQIVKGLKSFSRMDKELYETFDIHNGLNTALLLLKNKYKNHIEIIKDYDPDLPNLLCFPGKINQAFMNILSNAIDAIEEKGTIWITTSRTDFTIDISIKDNGRGIPADDIKKLFDPFFTTKEVGKGTGLGLSITYGIINDHKGKIIVNSELGKGSEFIITLPLT